MPVGLVAVFFQSVSVLLATRMIVTERSGFMSIYRVMAFADSPLVLGVVPLVGTFGAYGYRPILQVTALQELCKVSLGRAYAVWFVSQVLKLLVLFLFYILAIIILETTLAISIPFIDMADSDQNASFQSGP